MIKYDRMVKVELCEKHLKKKTLLGSFLKYNSYQGAY